MQNGTPVLMMTALGDENNQLMAFAYEIGILRAMVMRKGKVVLGLWTELLVITSIFQLNQVICRLFCKMRRERVLLEYSFLYKENSP